MARPGDVVWLSFPGATGVKRRPGVIVSSEKYHQERPDVIVGLVTGNVAGATKSSDAILRDWREAGLQIPSAFRCYLFTCPAEDVDLIGTVTSEDWKLIRAAISAALPFE